MKKIIEKIFCNIGENDIEVGQNANGIWRCKSLKIKCDDIFDGLGLMYAAMDLADEMLQEKNQKKNE